MKHALICLMVLLQGFVSFAESAVRTILVTASAERPIEPDMVQFNAEIWSKAATGQRAQMLAAEKLKEVLANLDQYKIAKEDIQTASYNFGPEYVWEGNQNKLVGFRSNQTLLITFKKVEQVGKLIDILSNSAKGGNGPRAESGVNINNIQWETSKRTQLENLALGDAVKVARDKAEQMAKAAGVKINSVYKLSHTSHSIIEPRRGYMTEVMHAKSMSAETQLSSGQIKVSVSVTAEYEIN